MLLELFKPKTEYKLKADPFGKYTKPRALIAIEDTLVHILTLSAGGSGVMLFGKLEGVQNFQQTQNLEFGAMAAICLSSTILTLKLCCNRKSS